VTIDELSAALECADWLDRTRVVERYSKQKPNVEAIPSLRKALADPYHATVKYAARSLRKLGTAAAEAMNDLLAAAAKPYPPVPPQAYPDCVEAMAAIQPLHPELLPLIRQHSMSYCNWVPISSSLRALKVIRTPEAVALMQEIVDFWEPKFDKVQRRVVQQLLSP
jgi:HEAT repeat protein